MTTIQNVFSTLKAQGNGALIAYITAGDPTPEHTPKIAEALIKGGIDILELGLPFSDPIADGPIIQEASKRALDAGTTPAKVLEMAKEIRQNHDTPLVIMTYFNPIFRMGITKFLNNAKECGINGIIIPDLPIEEATEYMENAKPTGIDTIFLAAPSTKTQRLQQIVNKSSGFLYLISHFGVTGTKTTLQDATIRLIKKTLPYTENRIPLAVGFGISEPDHIKKIIQAGADGAIVGSTFVKIISQNLSNPHKMLQEIETKAKILKQATIRKLP